MAMAAPKHLETLSKHTGPDDFKRRIHMLLDATLKQFKTTGSQILVATYVPQEKTSGGIFIPGKSQQENLFQGKAALVLQTGPLAFVRDRYNCPWDGLKCAPNDWVMFRFADGWDMYLGGVHCWIIDHESIRAIVDDPTVIY